MPSTKATATAMLAHADAAPRCRHVRLNNQRCGSPAKSGSQFCVFHYGDYEGHLPMTGVPEDAATIQIEITKVIRQLQDGNLPPKNAGMILYALQVASQNLARLNVEMPSLEQQEFPEEYRDLAWHLIFRLRAPQAKRDEVKRLCFQLAE